MLHNNIAAFVITLILAVAWLRFVGMAVLKKWIPSSISRKVIHIGTGPLFVLCWMLFDSNSNGRFLAAIVPLISTVQYVLAGLGILKDDASVQSMSRSGIREELLKGPFLYGVVFILLTLFFWKNSLIGICALMILCGGDGLADVFGKKYGTRKLPWAEEKTWAGSMAMILGGFLLSLIVVTVLSLTGTTQINFAQFLIKLPIVVIISTLVESISRSDIDNLTVPLAAVATGLLISL